MNREEELKEYLLDLSDEQFTSLMADFYFKRQNRLQNKKIVDAMKRLALVFAKEENESENE